MQRLDENNGSVEEVEQQYVSVERFNQTVLTSYSSGRQYKRVE